MQLAYPSDGVAHYGQKGRLCRDVSRDDAPNDASGSSFLPIQSLPQQGWVNLLSMHCILYVT